MNSDVMGSVGEGAATSAVTTTVSSSALSESLTLGDRNRSDGCPGALRVHAAKDGGIGRVRVPGGQVSPELWEMLAGLAETFGDGNLHITTRGNLQVRGIVDVEGFAAAVADAGLLPSRAHDRMRNIIVSPLAPELLPLVAELDSVLLADEVVAGLSGRTLFGVDSGVGDVLSREPDFGLVSCGTGFEVVLGGVPTGVCVNKSDAAPALVRTARQWQQVRGTAWRVAERPDLRAGLLAVITGGFDTTVASAPLSGGVVPSPPIGWLAQDEHARHSSAHNNSVVSLGAGVRFGQLSAQLARMIAVIGARSTVTPWHSVVLHDLEEAVAEQVVRVLAPLGLVFDADSVWLRVSACTGSAGCEKSLSDTRQDAVQAVSLGLPSGRVHFSGCERRCGHPLGRYTDYVATACGEYDVSTR